MPRHRTSVKPYKSATRPHLRWVLNVWHRTGKRERFFFETKTEAERQKEIKNIEVENLGVRALEITDQLRHEALEAQEWLKPYRVTIREVVLEYVQKRSTQSAVVDDLAKAYIESRIKNGCSERHLKNIRNFYRRFVSEFSGQMASDIDSETIEAWFDRLKVGAVSVNSYRTLLHALFGYAVRKRLCARIEDNNAKTILDQGNCRSLRCPSKNCAKMGEG